MEETDDNMSADDIMMGSPSSVKVKPKKRSLVERELETSLTARVTSPVTNAETSSTSRYGRARRMKTDPEYMDPEKAIKQMKSPVYESTPIKVQSPVYKMHASNSPIKTEPKETPKKGISPDSTLDNQIENIYHENISLSRFGSDEKKTKSSGSKFPKVYVRTDLIQKREKDDTVVLIKNMFSPVKSPYKSTNSHLNNILERSSEKYHLNTASKSHNGYMNTMSVVKTLDFDSKKKIKKENRDNKVLSKSDLFDMEAKCEYQVGDLAWARMGTYPFWPCIVTREPSTGMFVKKKLFGRIERDVIHVTFFGDNGRRGWIVDTMLRKFLGQLEFESTRERFSPAAKKRDPRLYAAFFISEKKMPQWSISVEEAEMLLREPKRLRIDLLNDMLAKPKMIIKSASKSQKSGKITRTASDVSLSESLYDTLFYEDDGKAEDPERSRSKSRKSLDVSEVVTACLDNMAAKTGITKIQKQSHMDRWLQKAKSKTPEKLQAKATPQKKEKEVKVVSSKKKKKVSPIVPTHKPYSLRRLGSESQNLKSHHNEHDYSSKVNDTPKNDDTTVAGYTIDVVAKVESLSDDMCAEEDVKEAHVTNENIDSTISEDLSKSFDNDGKEQNATLGPISADDTVDEIQVNICSIEEHAELESCMQSEVDLNKSTKHMNKKSEKITDNVLVDPVKHTESIEMDLDQSTSLDESNKLVKSKIESDKRLENANSISDQIESKNIDLDEEIRSLEAILQEKEADSTEVNMGDISTKSTLIKSSNVVESPSPQKRSTKPIISRKLRVTRHTRNTPISSEIMEVDAPTEDALIEIAKKDNNIDLKVSAENTDLNPLKLKKNRKDMAKLKENEQVLNKNSEAEQENLKNVLLSPNSSDNLVKDINVVDDHSPLKRSTKPIICRNLRLKRQTRSSPVSAEKMKVCSDDVAKDITIKDTQTDISLESIDTYPSKLKEDMKVDSTTFKDNLVTQDLENESQTKDDSKILQKSSPLNSDNLVKSKTVQDQITPKQSPKPTIRRKTRFTRQTRGTPITTESVEVDLKDTSEKIPTKDCQAEVTLEKVDKTSETLKENIELNSTSRKDNMQVLENTLETKEGDSQNIIKSFPIGSDKPIKSPTVGEQSPHKRSPKPILIRKLRLTRQAKSTYISTECMEVDSADVSKEIPTKYSQAEVSPEKTGINSETLIENTELHATTSKDNVQESKSTLETKEDDSQILISSSPISLDQSSTVEKPSSQDGSPKLITNRKLRVTRHAKNTSISMESLEVDSEDASKEKHTKDSQAGVTSQNADINLATLKENKEFDTTQWKDNVLENELETKSDNSKKLVTSPQISSENVLKNTNVVDVQSLQKRSMKPIIFRKLSVKRLTKSSTDVKVEAKKHKKSVEVSLEDANKEIQLSSTNKKEEILEESRKQEILPELLDFEPAENKPLAEKVPESTQSSSQVSLEEKLTPIENDVKIIETIIKTRTESHSVLQIVEQIPDSMKEQDDNAKSEEKSTTENDIETTIGQEDSKRNTESVTVANLKPIMESLNTMKHNEKTTECQKIISDELIENTSNTTTQLNDNLKTIIQLQEDDTQNIGCSPEPTDSFLEDRKQDDNVQSTEYQEKSLALGPDQNALNRTQQLNTSPQCVKNAESTQNELEKILSTQEKTKESTPVTSEPKLVENKSDDDMEYDHLHFTENRSNEVKQQQLLECAQINQNQATPLPPKETPSFNMGLDDEDKEYGHLDFIFSSCGENFTDTYKDITKESILLENHNTFSNALPVQKVINTTDNIKSCFVADRKVVSLDSKEESIVNAIKFNTPKQRELRVSVEKLPLCSLPNSVFKENKENGVHKDNHCLKNNSENTLKYTKDQVKDTEHAFQEVTSNGDDVNNVSKMSVDELDGKTDTHDSEKVTNVENNCSLMINNKDTEVNNEVIKCAVADDVLTEDLEKKVEKEECPKHVDIMEPKLDDDAKNSNSISSKLMNIETDQCTNIVSEFKTISQVSVKDSKVSEHVDNIISDDVRKVNDIGDINKDSDTFVMSLNRLPQPVKLNGFHVDECIDFSDGEFNVETSSINSEDSEPLSVTKSKLLSKSRSKAKKALENTEFIKYCELRQDMLMDEHPELSQDEIVEYLFKTWEYEETTKHDLVKSDDIEQSGLVKGLNSNLRQKTIRNNHRASKKRNKKRDEDTYSINSDASDSSVKRKLRTRAAKSPTISIEESEGSIEIKTELLETISINSDVSHNSVKEVIKVPDNKEEEPPVVEELKNNVPQPATSTQTDEICTDLEENKEKSVEIKPKSIKKEKIKSPKSKENSLKNYFKVANPVNGTDNRVEEQNVMIAEATIKQEYDPETASINSEDSEVSISKKKRKYGDKNKSMTDPEFLKYVELRQDHLIDENPELTEDEITSYLYKTWLYEENAKSDIKKTEELETASMVKGLNVNVPQPKKIKKKIKVEKDFNLDVEVLPKEKPKRKTSQPYYNEDLYDMEDEIELFEIFKKKKIPTDGEVKGEGENTVQEDGVIELDDVDEVELYFSQLTDPKPNVFKGLVREKVCDICERTGNLVKCKGCHGMFHVDCVTKAMEVVEAPAAPTRGRKKKKRLGRKPKNLEDSESHSDDKSQDVSEELNASIEDEMEPRTVNADDFEAALAAKMQELVPTIDITYDSDSSVEILDWRGTAPGKCVIVDVKLKPKIVTDYSNFKCNNCQVYDSPVCFVCKQAQSKTGVELRQKCQTARCNKYYHLECLDHWPQTQFQAGEPSKSNKKINEHFEALMCPRHVCHTCVSDDPRGCKTRFSGDKLARCVRCPATYHSFTKCLPAGSQILTGSLIVCPRHYEHRPGKVPYHVNTGWCFICALGGSLICCEYCPTSFHAECLNIKPPEGGYMCEDCETGRLPLYGEMVWVKLGHYRWWPGIILHPCEIPENILAVKHSPGEFVVRFFGQYDHYWVNRGRVFPFQEGDSGNISSQKSKIDAAFTTAMEHAQRACEIMKNAKPNEEESQDIASSLLPPHYVKLKVNKPCGSLVGRRADIEESSLTQCECSAADADPCGPYSHCLNRMLLTECGPICRAGDRCNNRAFEKRQYPRMTPYRTPHRGWGLKTLEDIKAGQFVIEYVGELIDDEEFIRRMNRKHEIRDENFYFLTLDKERMIDAGPKGNLARFMNHCCDPNCETQKWTVLGDVRVGLFALYDIPANSELTFNYNLECAGIDKKRCMCGARRCAGYIGAKPKQEEAQPKKAKLPGKRTYKKRKIIEVSPSTSKPKPKRPVGRPAKPRELTEIEKDLLIIKNATNGISSDSEGSGRLSSFDSERCPKALKRKRVSFSTEESGSKKAKVEEKSREADCLDT